MKIIKDKIIWWIGKPEYMKGFRLWYHRLTGIYYWGLYNAIKEIEHMDSKELENSTIIKATMYEMLKDQKPL